MKYNRNIIMKVINRSDILAVVLTDSTKMVKVLPDSRFCTNCFFHNDRRPSMVIDLKNNRYYCSACKSNGNVVNLLMHIHNLKFLTSIETLAYAFNINLPERSFVNIELEIAESIKHAKDSEEYKKLLIKSYSKQKEIK